MSLNLQAKISLDSASFERGMHRVTESVMHTVKSYALGAVGAYTLHSAFEKTIETVKELVETSERMGVTVEKLQVMRKAASESGVEIEKLAGAMEKLNIARSKALGGGAGAGKALGSFAALGVSKDQLQTLPAQDIIFGAIRKKIEEVNPQQIAAPLRDVLGKGFGPLIPLMTKDLDAVRSRMQKMGMIISTQTAYELKQLDTAIKTAQNIVISKLAPVLVQFGELIVKAMGKISGAAGFYGAGTSSWTWKDVGNALLGNAPLPKFNSSAAEGAFNEAEGPWIELLKQLQKSGEGKAPLIPDFTGGMVDGKGNKKHTAGHLERDSLVSAGNFLGSIRSEIPTIEQKKVDLLTRIAVASERMASNASSAGDDGEGDWAN